MSTGKENLKNVSFASLAPIGTLGARRTALIQVSVGIMMVMFGWPSVPEIRCALYEVMSVQVLNRTYQ